MTLLYTLLNLTGLDAALGWRATVERVSWGVKSRSPRSALEHSHARFSGRARHPSVCFPSSVTRFCFQDLNILLFFFLSLPDFADMAPGDVSLCLPLIFVKTLKMLPSPDLLHGFLGFLSFRTFL